MDQNLDEQTLHQLEEVLHTEILPGTEIMKDVGSHHFVKAGGGHHDVLVPQPSDDEHDPLNWSPFWKFAAIFSSTLVTFTQGFGPLALAPMFPFYMEEWNSSLGDVVQFTGVAILVLGFSNFIWVPIMTSWGRRPCLLFSTLVCLGSAIWRARADSYGSFMGACVLNGFAAGPAETVQPVVIADVIFLHERGAYNALYFATYFISLMVGPIVGGAMAENVGWRNFWWLNVALNGVALLCCLFLFPETRFHRPMGGRGEGKTLTTLESPSNAGEEIALGDGKDVIVATNTKEITDIITNDTEKAAPAQPLSPTPSLSPILGSGRPSKQQWALFQPFRGALLSEFLLPWKLLLFPIVLLASFTVSWSASVFLMTNLTQSQVFAAPPYNFSSQTVGFFNFATLAGALVGLFTAGPLSDHVAEVLTRRNGGVREPEMRLLAAVPYVVVMIVGNVVVAMGYEQKWPWELIVILGYTFIGIQVTALPSIFSTYAVDSYKPVAGAIFVAITVNKNVWGYGFSRFVTPWSQQAGYVAPILTNMALVTLWCGCGVVFWFQGKTFRRWTRESDVHVERSG